MPDAAVKAIGKVRDLDLPFLPVESCHQPHHLVVLQPMLIDKLVISDAGVSFPHFHHPVQYKLSVTPPIQRKIILLQLLRHRGEPHTVDPLPQHRKHTRSLGREFYTPTSFQLLLDQRQQLLKTVFFLTPGIHFHSAFAQIHALPFGLCPRLLHILPAALPPGHPRWFPR